MSILLLLSNISTACERHKIEHFNNVMPYSVYILATIVIAMLSPAVDMMHKNWIMDINVVGKNHWTSNHAFKYNIMIIEHKIIQCRVCLYIKVLVCTVAIILEPKPANK